MRISLFFVIIYGLLALFESLESSNCTEAGDESLDSLSRCLHAWAPCHIHTYLLSVRFRRPTVIRMCAWAHQRSPPSTRVWVCVCVWVDSSSRLTSCKPWNKLVCGRRRDLWWLYGGGGQRRGRNGTKNLNPNELQQWRAFPVASPDDVQMINVCKITAISQTLCILPSVPAHFLQLLRDACGSLLKTTRPNFKHFLPTLPHFSDPQYLRLPSAVRRDSSEPCGSSLFTESSILD